ncbi:MAG: hypothetical protein AAB288_02515, partial [Acidobacteriota bacterium]
MLNKEQVSDYYALTMQSQQTSFNGSKPVTPPSAKTWVGGEPWPLEPLQAPAAVPPGGTTSIPVAWRVPLGAATGTSRHYATL